MSIDDTEKWLRKVVKELRKHAERDNCYKCKQLLKNPILKRFIEGKSL